MTGFATSVIGCGCEAGIDRALDAARDAGRAAGRARAAVRDSTSELQKQLAARVGAMRADQPGLGLLCGARRRGEAQARQCAALFRRRLADLQALRRQALLAHAGHGRRVRLRGDHRPHQAGGRRRQPAHHGRAARRRRSRRRKPPSKAIARSPTSIVPFPGRHRALGLEGRLEIQGRDRLDQRRLLPDAAGARSKTALDRRHRVGAGDRHRRPDVARPSRPRCAPGIAAIVKLGPKRGAVRIGAGNYGGKLGPHHFHLKDLLP